MRLRRMRGFLPVILTVLLTSACGGSADDETGPAASEDTPPPVTATTTIPPTTTTATTTTVRTTTTTPPTATATTTTTTSVPAAEDSGTTAESGPLVGLWVTHHGYYVLRTADGVYNLGYTPGGAESAPFGWGTYTFDADEGILVFTSAAGTHCGADSTGIYEAVITDEGDSVTFTLVEDPCRARPANMTGEQTRYSPTE